MADFASPRWGAKHGDRWPARNQQTAHQQRRPAEPGFIFSVV